MFNQRLFQWLVPALLLTTPLMAESRLKIASLAQHESLFKWAELLDGYQERYVRSQLTWREFHYAQKWVCPMFPTPTEMHLCNSSVVGTSEPNPDEPIHYKPSITIKQTCLPCLLQLKP